MHSSTCEAFLESIASRCDGVTTAEASYVSENMHIRHRPDLTSVSELCDALSTVGYAAYPRADSKDDSSAAERNSLEMSHRGDRGLEDILGFRYAAGVIFGAFMLLPYAVFLYPAQLAGVFDDETLDLFASASGVGGGDRLLILPVFLVLTGVVLFFTGLPLLRGAYVSLKMRRPNTDLLVTITVGSAYIYSTAAFLLGRIDVYYDLTIVIAAGVVAAIFYESLVKRRALDLLTDLTVSHVDEASRYCDDGTTNTIPVGDLEQGDRVLVRQGERIPVDGVLDEGECTVDEAVTTGESIPMLKRAGDDIIGGAVVTDGAAIIRIGDRASSSIDRLISTVWALQSADHGVQRRADRLASNIIPVVVGVAGAVTAAVLALGYGTLTAFLSFLTVLLVACPWALGLATPLSVATSIEEAMERGIVVFDETVFERLLDVDVVVFDKTGTLTTGVMDVIEADAPDELLEAAAELERFASHPAANAIATAFAHESTESDGVRTDGGVGDDHHESGSDRVSDFRTHSIGVEGNVDGAQILVGHLDLFTERGWSVSGDLATRVAEVRGVGRLPVVVGRDGVAEGFIVVGDKPRDGWDESVAELSERGIEVIVLTGDDEAATEFFSRHRHVDHIFAGVPPEGKTATIQRLQSEKHVTMVGDGTNDAPALAKADLGISLGSGTAIASDAADITIVDDDLGAVVTAFDLASAARRRVNQNNVLALVYNGIVIPLAIAGLLNPIFTAVAVLVTGGLIGANSTRDLIDE